MRRFRASVFSVAAVLGVFAAVGSASAQPRGKVSPPAAEPAERSEAPPIPIFQATGPIEERRITLRGSDLPLGSVLTQIARSAGTALVIDKEVLTEAVVNPNLENLTLPAALAVMLTPFGYSYALDHASGFLRVFINETRTFKVSLPFLVQDWQTEISNEGQGGGESGGGGSGGGGGGGSGSGGGGSGGGGGGTSLGARVALSTKSDSKGLWEEVEQALSKLVGTNGTYSVNRVAGFVTVRTTPSVMVSVASYFDALNAEMGRAVTVEVQVLQVDLKNDRAAGVDWDVVTKKLTNLGLVFGLTLTTSAISPTSGGIFQIGGAAGDAFLKVLEEQGELKLVARPKLVLGNNLPAIIDVGTVTSYVSSQTTTISPVGGLAQVTVQTSSISDGLILSILPRLMENGEVTLALGVISQDLVDLRRQEFGGGFVELPKVSRRGYNGVVRTRRGNSLVIGGLLSERDETRTTGLPFLSRIPVVGFLFGTTKTIKIRSELVLTITPDQVLTAGKER